MLGISSIKLIDYIIYENKIELEPIKYFINAVGIYSHPACLSREISNQIFRVII